MYYYFNTITMIFTWVYHEDYYDYFYSCYTNEQDSISLHKFVLLHETVSLRFHQLEPHASIYKKKSSPETFTFFSPNRFILILSLNSQCSNACPILIKHHIFCKSTVKFLSRSTLDFLIGVIPVTEAKVKAPVKKKLVQKPSFLFCRIALF